MEKSFNLNDASFDAGSSVSIFNNGISGIAENCKARVERTKQEDKTNDRSPDYKIFFMDTNGAEINTAFWYPKEDESIKNIERTLKKLKHIGGVFCGEDSFRLS